MQLYKISDELSHAMLEAIDEETGEINPALADALNALEIAFNDKVGAIVSFIKNTKAEQEAFEAEAERLAKRATTLAKRQQWLKDYIKCEMTRQQMSKSGTELHGARIQANGQPSMIAKSDVPLSLDTITTGIKSLERKSPTTFAAMVGAWRVSIELSSSTLQKDEQLPENKYVEFVKGNHLRVK